MQESKIVKGVGYSMLYSSPRVTYEVSVNNTVLRQKVIKNNISHEYLYKQVEDSEQIRKIEEKSVKWILLGNRSYDKNNYYVMIQVNSYNRETGNIKIIEKRNAKVYGIFDISVQPINGTFIYYKQKER